MFIVEDRIVLAMALIRLCSGMIELLASFLMFKFDSRVIAFQINSFLALIGPAIMLIVTSIGLVGLANKLSLLQMSFIILGVVLIFIGIKI